MAKISKLKKGEKVAVSNRAFTLVELLVVVTIVGILTAILLPAVQMVRDSARKTHCSNNARQLVLGLQSYEVANGRFPPANDILEDAKYFGLSWIGFTLPFIEQNTKWEILIEDYRSSPYEYFKHKGFRTVCTLVGCPSDPSSGKLNFVDEDLEVASTSYVGVSGTNYREANGVFGGFAKTRLQEITDGNSNTLILGERPPSPDFLYGNWYAAGLGFIPYVNVVLGVAEINPGNWLSSCPNGPYRFLAGQNEQCDTLHFWSNHSGGANFALADGSVRLIPYSISAETLQALATRAGGETVALDF